MTHHGGAMLIGFRATILDSLPTWCVRYTIRLLEFIEHEHRLLPLRLVGHSTGMPAGLVHHRNSYRAWLSPSKGGHEHEDSLQEALGRANDIRQQRIQHLVITLDKIKYFLRNQPKVNAVHPGRSLSGVNVSHTSPPSTPNLSSQHWGQPPATPLFIPSTPDMSPATPYHSSSSSSSVPMMPLLDLNGDVNSSPPSSSSSSGSMSLLISPSAPSSSPTSTAPAPVQVSSTSTSSSSNGSVFSPPG